MTSRGSGRHAATARDAGFERARALAFERALASTVEQRVAWLEEALAIARASGALAAEVEQRRLRALRLWHGSSARHRL